MANTFPILKFLPYFRRSLKSVEKNRLFLQSIVTKYVDEHIKTFEEANIRDYIDAFLAVQRKETHNIDSTFTQSQLIRSVQDLFAAGSETTGTTLRWALALMALHHKLQSKVQHEIDQRLGQRQPKMADKSELKFIEAVLLEVQRYACVVPMVRHVANTDCDIGGYPVYENDAVYLNVVRLHRHPDVWPYPDEFNVENFWKEDEVINRNYFMAFSVGKRACLGESLAKMETFLFFVTLLQKFNFRFDPGYEPDLSNPPMGIIRSPASFKITATSR